MRMMRISCRISCRIFSEKKRSSKGIWIEDLPEKSILQPRHRMLDMSSLRLDMPQSTKKKTENIGSRILLNNRFCNPQTADRRDSTCEGNFRYTTISWWREGDFRYTTISWWREGYFRYTKIFFIALHDYIFFAPPAMRFYLHNDAFQSIFLLNLFTPPARRF